MDYADMSYNWTDAAERAKAARAHTEKMASEFPNEIAYSVGMSKIYDDSKGEWKHEPRVVRRRPTVNVVDEDSVSAIFAVTSGKIAALNFSSFKNPGGKFLDGSRAQEESLCHESCLYNVLSEFDKSFYRANRADTNSNLYRNRALYTPEVLFIHQSPHKIGKRIRHCDVITCAAPNKRAAAHKIPITELSRKNSEALESRIKFILSIAEANKVDTLVLGAYGCGVFRQDPIQVAVIFKERLKEFDFRQVVFAIPNGNNGNLRAFRDVLFD